MHDTHMQSCTELSLKAFASCLEAASCRSRAAVLFALYSRRLSWYRFFGELALFFAELRTA